jgi:hypothetical protein
VGSEGFEGGIIVFFSSSVLQSLNPNVFVGSSFQTSQKFNETSIKKALSELLKH